MALEEVGARLVVAGQDQFQQAFDDAQRSIDHLSDSITKAEKPTNTLTAKSMALAVALGQALYSAAITAGKAIIDFTKDSISAASNLNETTTKVGVVFGKEADKVLAFGKTAANSFGMSENAALAAAGTYGNLFRSMGMTEDASSDMSIELVKLAGDLASFNNIKPEEALEKLRAGLVGESEPLKSLGINLNEAAIKEEALRLGLIKEKGVLDANTKAQAAYSLIMKQSSLAQGDFARTSTGMANQQRILAANLENTKATLGTALLPIVNKVMIAFNSMLNSPQFQAALQGLIEGISKVVDFVSTNWPVVQAIFQRVAGQVQAIVSNLWDRVKGMFGAAFEFIQTLVSFVLTNIQVFWQAHGEKVMAVVNWLWTTIQTIFNTAIGIVTAIFNAFTDLLQGNWEAFGQHLLDAWNILWGAIRSAAEGAWALLSAWFQGIVQAIVGFFTNTDWGAVGLAIVNGIWAGLQAGWAWLVTQVQNLAASLLEAALAGARGSAYGGGVVNPNPPPVPGYATGGSFRIPDYFGYEGFNLGGMATASGGERIVILPKSMSAGPVTNSYSTANNYNLQVMTSQSPQVVQRSFAMMKLLAG